MNAKDIRSIQEAYCAVYAPQELSEEVEIATEYFYEMGLNEEGVDILIEELGIEEFAEFVYDIAEEYTLTEARAARKRKGGKSYAEVKAEIDAKEREKATTKAVKKQPKTKVAPPETKTGIAGRIGAALGSAVKRGREDIGRVQDAAQTARDVATRRSAETKAVYDALRERGKKAEQSATATRARRRATVAVGRAAQEVGNTAIKAAGAAGASAGAGVAARRSGATGAQIAGRAAGTFVRKMKNEGYEYHQLLKFLYFEGYADSYEEAEYIIEDMSIEEFEELVESYKGGQPLPPADQRSLENIGRMNRGDYSVPPGGSKPNKTKSASRIKPAAPAPAKKRRVTDLSKIIIAQYLFGEGYTDSIENAETMADNISEEWIDSILEDLTPNNNELK